MDENVIADFKQFIAAQLSQQATTLREDIRADVRGDMDDIRSDIQRLDQKIDDLSDSVAQALATSNDAVDTQLQDHETRITNLESQAA